MPRARLPRTSRAAVWELLFIEYFALAKMQVMGGEAQRAVTILETVASGVAVVDGGGPGTNDGFQKQSGTVASERARAGTSGLARGGLGAAQVVEPDLSMGHVQVPLGDMSHAVVRLRLIRCVWCLRLATPLQLHGSLSQLPAAKLDGPL